MAKPFNVVDLFSGLGGLSIGMSLTNRFRTCLAWDSFAEAVETFKSVHGLQYCSYLQDDIRINTEARLMDALAKVEIGPGQVDVVVGGPPCEGFSQNRSVNSGGDWRLGGGTRVTKFIEDPRNDLFVSFLNVVSVLNPKVALIENVPAIVKHKEGGTLSEILQTLHKMGYVARARVLNAADFGVPQLRRRAFIIAQRICDFERSRVSISLPSATHHAYPLPSQEMDADTSWLPGDCGYWPSVREAIGDLPEPDRRDGISGASTYDFPPNSDLRRYLRGGVLTGLTHHTHRIMGDGGLSRVKALQPRQNANDLPAHLKPKSYFHHSYSRLVWADPARTITKFVYNVGSGMFAHPSEDRAITMREAARLQTIPDSVKFQSKTIRDVSAMIGNAIPPILAWKIGKEIARYLDNISVSDPAISGKALRTDAVLRRLEGQVWDNQNTDRQSRISFSEPSSTFDYSDADEMEEQDD